MELDGAGGGGGVGMGEAPIVYRIDSGAGLSSTSSSLRQNSAGALGGGGDSTTLSPAQAPNAAAAAPVTAGEEEGPPRPSPAHSPFFAPAAGATAASTGPAARRGASSKASRFEQLVSQSFEESKLRSAPVNKTGGGSTWAARLRQAGLRVARNVVIFLNSRSTSMVRALFLMMMIALGGGCNHVSI